jgi:hypothetical protein
MTRTLPVENLVIEAGRTNPYSHSKTVRLKAGCQGFYKAITCLLFIFLSFCLPASAQRTSATSTKVIERINSIEQENQRLKDDISDLEEEQDDLKEKNKDLEATLKEYEPLKNGIWVLTVLGIGSLAGLAWLGFKHIPSKVNSQVDAIITKILTDRREDFLGLLKEYDFEKSVKQRHQIILLSHRSGSDDYHHRMLTKNGFQVTALTNLDQLHQAVFNPDDILVINNDGGHWPTDQIQDFIDAHPNYCFYFGKGMINPANTRLDRFAAANFRTQFIGNLMNVLKYSHHQN